MRQWTGITTCIGLGPTKTLAKLANHIAKKIAELGGVCDLTSAAARGRWLDKIEVGEVWGIGGASERKLLAIDLDPRLALKMLSVVGERTVLELRRHGLETAHLSVFMHTSEFNARDRPYSAATTVQFPESTNDTLDLVKAAQRAERAIYRDGF